MTTSTDCRFCGSRIKLIGGAWCDEDFRDNCWTEGNGYEDHAPVSRAAARLLRSVRAK